MPRLPRIQSCMGMTRFIFFDNALDMMQDGFAESFFTSDASMYCVPSLPSLPSPPSLLARSLFVSLFCKWVWVTIMCLGHDASEPRLT